jgi:predicted DNA-binding ribbon-helix-helix protein
VSRPVKRSFSIKGHRTSISLEAEFWVALKEAAQEDSLALAALIDQIDRDRGTSGLSSAVRIWLLRRYISRSSGTS